MNGCKAQSGDSQVQWFMSFVRFAKAESTSHSVGINKQWPGYALLLEATHEDRM